MKLALPTALLLISTTSLTGCGGSAPVKGYVPPPSNMPVLPRSKNYQNRNTPTDCVSAEGQVVYKPGDKGCLGGDTPIQARRL